MDFNRTQHLPSIEEINKICASYFGMKNQDLCRGYRGQRNEPRKVATYGCRMWAAETLSAITVYYQCKSHSAVSNVVNELKKPLQFDSTLVDPFINIKIFQRQRNSKCV